MHTLEDPRNLLPSLTTISKTCIGCQSDLPIAYFQRDSSYRDGRRDLCEKCASSPRLSTQEHICRLKELNRGSEAIKRQQWQHQEDYRNNAARVGRTMHHSEFFLKLKKYVPSLYIIPGNIKGDFALYKTYGSPQKRLDGATYEYLFYSPMGWMPEFSQYEFDHMDIPVRESKRGWRTPLLRLIRNGMITEKQANQEFGEAMGLASVVWNRQLYIYKNKHD